MVSSEQLLVLSVVLAGAKIPGSGSGRWVKARRQPTAKRRRRRHGRGGRELDNIGPRKTSPHRRALLDRHQSRRPVVSRAARPRERATKAERGAGSAAAVPRSGAALDAISVQQNGKAASATTIARKRSVFANVIRYALEKEEMRSNPLDRMSWKPPQVSEVVDRRVVVNPRQARELLTAVTYVGHQRRGPHARGQRLMGCYACMYYAALRPAEVVGLRRQDCHLPKTGWGRLTLEKSRPEVNRRSTDTDSAHDERGLTHRAADETRRVPTPPELVASLPPPTHASS